MMSSSSSSLAGHSSSSRRRASSTYNGTSGINSLYEFLEEAELQHHYLGLRNVLRVQSVSQLRSVREDDLVGIGMSQKEALRLRVRAHSGAGAAPLPGHWGRNIYSDNEQQRILTILHWPAAKIDQKLISLLFIHKEVSGLEWDR